MEQKNETEVVQNQRITDSVIWKQIDSYFSIPDSNRNIFHSSIM